MSDSDLPERERAGNRACPICGKPRDPRYEPFCSKRCADVDLHRWLKGNYVIPGAEPGDEAGEKEERET